MAKIDTKSSYDPYKLDGGKEYHEAINGGVGSRGYMLVAKRRAEKLQPFISNEDTVLEFGIGPEARREK